MTPRVLDKFTGEALVLLEVGCVNSISRVAVQLGLSVEEADRCILSCISMGFAAVEGNRSGFVVTTDGKAALQDYLVCWRPNLTPPIAAVLAEFRVVNDQFKSELMSSLRDGAQYGLDGVIEAIGTAQPLFDKLYDWGARYDGYRRRLDSAAAKVLAGHDAYLVGAGSESVHSAWWEWHQDLLITTGTRRDE